MKTTLIHIRAFNKNFYLGVKKKDYLDLQKCIKYVRHELGWDTAMIKEVIQDNITIVNRNYRDPEEICFNKNLQTA